MNAKLAIVAGVLILFIIISYGGSEGDMHENTTASWAYVSSVSGCDRKYDEATRQQSNPNGRTYTLTFAMDSKGFFDKCAAGNSGPWSEPCPYYQKCIATVKNNIPATRDMAPLSYADTAEYVRDYLVKTNVLKNTTVSAKGIPENILEACSNVSERGEALEGKIYGSVPEVADLEIAGQLATKARDGYGQCICVIADHINIDVNMSIGKCVADTFVQY